MEVTQKKRKMYALAAAVGTYQQNGFPDLPCFQKDLSLIETALVSGLQFEKENIRFLGEEGTVTVESLVRALLEFQTMLREEDLFVFYFSGHGWNGNLAFTDGEISLESLLHVMEEFPAKSRIMILDCCCAGGFGVLKTRKMNLEESIHGFVGKGTAILASAAEKEAAWLGPGEDHSLYTGLVLTAMTLNRKVRNGKVFLSDISEEIRRLAEAWNTKYPDKVQHPIFRSDLGGTICFSIEEPWKMPAYEPKKIHEKRNGYDIWAVEPSSSLEEKRLAVFVKTQGIWEIQALAELTKKEGERLCMTEVHSGWQMEERFRKTPASVIWFYFGQDESDLVNHRYYGRSIWALNQKMQEKYFEVSPKAVVKQGACVILDGAYPEIRRIQEEKMGAEEFYFQGRQLLEKITAMAEALRSDLEETANHTKTLEEVRKQYQPWSEEVRLEYLNMTEDPMAPAALHDWWAVAEDLIGKILDIWALLERKEPLTKRQVSLMRRYFRGYDRDLEKLEKLETDIEKNSAQ